MQGKVGAAPTQDVAAHLEMFATTRPRELAQGTTRVVPYRELALNTDTGIMMMNKDSSSTGSPSGTALNDSDITYIQTIQSNTPCKRTFHIGEQRYLIFAGPNGIIEAAHLKEWDGQEGG